MLEVGELGALVKVACGGIRWDAVALGGMRWDSADCNYDASIELMCVMSDSLRR
jgi:hypothetical protein